MGGATCPAIERLGRGVGPTPAAPTRSLLAAVNLADDTNTTGAVAGGRAGLA